MLDGGVATYATRSFPPRCSPSQRRLYHSSLGSYRLLHSTGALPLYTSAVQPVLTSQSAAHVGRAGVSGHAPAKGMGHHSHWGCPIRLLRAKAVYLPRGKKGRGALQGCTTGGESRRRRGGHLLCPERKGHGTRLFSGEIQESKCREQHRETPTHESLSAKQRSSIILHVLRKPSSSLMTSNPCNRGSKQNKKSRRETAGAQTAAIVQWPR